MNKDKKVFTNILTAFIVICCASFVFTLLAAVFDILGNNTTAIAVFLTFNTLIFLAWVGLIITMLVLSKNVEAEIPNRKFIMSFAICLGINSAFALLTNTLTYVNSVVAGVFAILEILPIVYAFIYACMSRSKIVKHLKNVVNTTSIEQPK